MVQFPNTDAELREIIAAVKAEGEIAAAARALGMPYSTAMNRYRAGLRKFDMQDVRPSRQGREVEAPRLPSSHEPIDVLIERRKATFERKKSSADAKRWMRFEIKEAAPFALVFVGDPHVDDDGADLAALDQHLDIVQHTPGMHAVGMGDWTNNWTGRLARLYAEQSTSTSEAWRLAEWVLQRPVWMLLLRGNHDMWSGSGDPLRWIANGSAPMVDWSAQFVVACGGKEWRIEAAHDFPGSSIWNKLHAPLRRAKLSGHEADLYVAAHRHTFALAEEQNEYTGRVAWLGRVRGYKAIDSYAAVNGYGQQQDRGQSIAAVCTPSDGRMRCYSDVAEAAEFLTWLRRPKATKKR